MVSSIVNDLTVLFDPLTRLTCTNNPDQSGSKSNVNEGVLHIPQSFWMWEGSLYFCRGAVGIFYSPS